MGYGQYTDIYPGFTRGDGKQALQPQEQKQMKRTRNVYPTNEIPHLWAHKTQPSARNPQGNLYFGGATIYSYGSHFPIARHITHAGKAAILFTTRSYSSTTAGHICAVRRAIPGNIPVFKIPLFDRAGEIRTGLAYHEERVKQALTALKAAKSRPSIAVKYIAYKKARIAANSFTDFFTSRKGIPPLPNDAELAAIYQEQERKRQERQAARDAKRSARWRAYEEERKRTAEEWAARMPELLEHWRAGETVPELSYCYGYYDGLPVALRLKGDMVETTKGARIPVSHAIAALALLRRLKANGQTYQRNGHTIHLGHYSLDSFDSDGTLTAGCHVIPWDEIMRFAPVLDQYAAEHGVTPATEQES